MVAYHISVETSTSKDSVVFSTKANIVMTIYVQKNISSMQWHKSQKMGDKNTLRL